MDDSHPPKPKRRWHQFRLRTLLLLVLLVSVGMSWFTVKLHRARRQRAAVEGILKSGGRVMYDYNYEEDGTPILDVDPPGPAWLQKMLGVDFFGDVETVLLTSDAGIEHLGALRSLEMADLDGPEVTDDTIKRLTAVGRFRRLRLFRTGVGDAGLAHVGELTSLESVEIYYAGITDDGLEHLEGLPRLKFLCLEWTCVTDAGLEHLKELTNLRELWLGGTHVTPEGVKKLQQALPNCEVSD